MPNNPPVALIAVVFATSALASTTTTTTTAGHRHCHRPYPHRDIDPFEPLVMSTIDPPEFGARNRGDRNDSSGMWNHEHNPTQPNNDIMNSNDSINTDGLFLHNFSFDEDSSTDDRLDVEYHFDFSDDMLIDECEGSDSESCSDSSMMMAELGTPQPGNEGDSNSQAEGDVVVVVVATNGEHPHHHVPILAICPPHPHPLETIHFREDKSVFDNHLQRNDFINHNNVPTIENNSDNTLIDPNPNHTTSPNSMSNKPDVDDMNTLLCDETNPSDHNTNGHHNMVQNEESSVEIESDNGDPNPSDLHPDDKQVTPLFFFPPRGPGMRRGMMRMMGGGGMYGSECGYANPGGIASATNVEAAGASTTTVATGPSRRRTTTVVEEENMGSVATTSAIGSIGVANNNGMMTPYGGMGMGPGGMGMGPGGFGGSPFGPW